MKRYAAPVLVVLVFAICLLAPGVSPAQQRGPSDEMIKANFREVLQSADKNRDGKLGMSECLAIWKDKKTGEKNCKYWDADSDGVITEDEYVRQVRKIMR
jgi:Ca2+-binding EF-hand superfamily protein